MFPSLLTMYSRSQLITVDRRRGATAGVPVLRSLVGNRLRPYDLAVGGINGDDRLAVGEIPACIVAVA